MSRRRALRKGRYPEDRSTRSAIRQSTLPSAALPPSAQQSANASAMSPAPIRKARWLPRSRRLGFDGVYDMNFTADLTIIEEATEFIDRVHRTAANLPLDHVLLARLGQVLRALFPGDARTISPPASLLSRCSAPCTRLTMQEEWVSTPADIVFVSAIPCTAKKFECRRPEQSTAGNGMSDVDYRHHNERARPYD